MSRIGENSMQTRYETFMDILKFLRSNIVFDHPVYVRRTKMPKGFDGDCQLKKRAKYSYFCVRIDNTLTEKEAIEVLLHEIAHCMSWGKGNEHNIDWGKAYSIVYRKFLQWNNEKPKVKS